MQMWQGPEMIQEDNILSEHIRKDYATWETGLQNTVWPLRAELLTLWILDVVKEQVSRTSNSLHFPLCPVTNVLFFFQIDNKRTEAPC